MVSYSSGRPSWDYMIYTFIVHVWLPTPVTARDWNEDQMTRRKLTRPTNDQRPKKCNDDARSNSKQLNQALLGNGIPHLFRHSSTPLANGTGMLALNCSKFCASIASGKPSVACTTSGLKPKKFCATLLAPGSSLLRPATNTASSHWLLT